MTQLLPLEREQLLGRIRGLCESQGECHIWRGAGAKSGKPRVILRNRTTDARRALLWAHTGSNPKPYARFTTECGNALCMNPAHVRIATATERDELPAWDFGLFQCVRCGNVRGRLTVLAPSTQCCGSRMRFVNTYEDGDLTRLGEGANPLPLSATA